MRVQMPDGLPGLLAVVDHHTVTLRIHPEGLGNAPGRGQQFSQDRNVGIVGVGEFGDVPLWNDEHMLRRLRTDVMKGKDIVVLEHFLRGNLTGSDFAKKTIAHAFFSVRLAAALALRLRTARR
jgi:hypothetical protein